MRSEPRNARIPVWPLSISLAATLEITVVFSSSGYLDVSVHRVPFHTLWIGVWMHEGFSCGFPHSDICGSMDICSSPQLFAAYHVFLRLLVPRHPPCALTCLTSLIYIALQMRPAWFPMPCPVPFCTVPGFLFLGSFDVFLRYFLKLFLCEFFKVQTQAVSPEWRRRDSNS